jgi:hypothetical protein
MSNREYNRALVDLMEALDKRNDVGEDIPAVRYEVSGLMKPDPSPGELWKDLSGFFWWIYEDKGVLMGRLLLKNGDGCPSPVYGDEARDPIEFTKWVASNY